MGPKLSKIVGNLALDFPRPCGSEEACGATGLHKLSEVVQPQGVRSKGVKRVVAHIGDSNSVAEGKDKASACSERTTPSTSSRNHWLFSETLIQMSVAQT